MSCDSSRIYESYQDIEGAIWASGNTKTFEFSIDDTTEFYNMFIAVRNTNSYPYNNCYLFVEMISPSEQVFLDTLGFAMADRTGKWLGSGIGNNWLQNIALVEGVKLLEKGTYKIKIEQGMREEELNGISDVGFRVEIADE